MAEIPLEKAARSTAMTFRLLRIPVPPATREQDVPGSRAPAAQLRRVRLGAGEHVLAAAYYLARDHWIRTLQHSRIKYRHGQQTYLLEPGDSLTFRGEIPHGPERLIELPIHFLSIIIYGGQGED